MERSPAPSWEEEAPFLCVCKGQECQCVQCVFVTIRSTHSLYLHSLPSPAIKLPFYLKPSDPPTHRHGEEPGRPKGCGRTSHFTAGTQRERPRLQWNWSPVWRISAEFGFLVIHLLSSSGKHLLQETFRYQSTVVLHAWNHPSDGGEGKFSLFVRLVKERLLNKPHSSEIHFWSSETKTKKPRAPDLVCAVLRVLQAASSPRKKNCIPPQETYICVYVCVPSYHTYTTVFHDDGASLNISAFKVCFLSGALRLLTVELMMIK